MDWLLVAVISGAAYYFGWLAGHVQGIRDGRGLERLERRIDELTETVRL